MATRQKPQRSEGLAAVIAAVLNVYGNGECLESECKQGLNHLVRAFGVLFVHRKPKFISAKATQAPEGTALREDHVIPVCVMMDHLMTRARGGKIEANEIENYLRSNSEICLITSGEDQRLRDLKLWNAVRAGAPCKAPERFHKWDRYTAAGIEPRLISDYPTIKPKKKCLTRDIMQHQGA